MRTVSNDIQTVLNSDYGETRDLVVIKIHEQTNPPLPDTYIYATNGEDIIVDGDVYQNKLRSISNIKFTLGKTTDTANLTLENVSKELGLTLNDTSRYIDGAEVIIKKAFKVSDGTWEAVTIFIGQIRGVKVDQEKVDINISSDMSKRASNIADRALTQRCIWVFNKDGSGVGPECGWLTTMPGDSNSCDHDLESANGCKAHGNQHRFGGVPSFTALNAGNGYDPNTGGTNWPTTGGGYCVHPETWILCVNTQGFRYWVQAMALNSERDFIVSMDRFGKYKRSNLKSTSKGATSQIITLITDQGCALRCSPSHPIITDFSDNIGTPAHKLEVGHEVITGYIEGGAYHKDFIKSVEILDTSCSVIMLHLEEPYHIFVASDDKDGGILSHNNKPLLDLDYRMVM